MIYRAREHGLFARDLYYFFRASSTPTDVFDFPKQHVKNETNPFGTRAERTVFT